MAHRQPKRIRLNVFRYSLLPRYRMASLVPQPDSQWLAVSTVVERAKAEFAFVKTDSFRAMKRLAEQFLSLDPSADHQAADSYLEPLSDSVELICADDPRSDEQFLKCFVVPQQPIEIEYLFSGHEAAAAGLLNRFAFSIGYSIIE